MDLIFVKGKNEGNISEQDEPQTEIHLTKSWPELCEAAEQTSSTKKS